jgi:hypothetical protein
MNNLVWADLDRDVVIVQGDDASAFLHSQLANDIASMAVGESRHSLLLEPTGHISVLARVVRQADTVFTLDVDSGHGEAVIKRLQRFVLRAKVTMRTSDWVVRAFRGTDARETVGSGNGRAVPHWGSPHEIDVVAEISMLPSFGEQTNQETIDTLRVDARWPRLGVDVLVGDIPATSGVLNAAASFTKGCYPGQELVERMDSRGSLAPVVLRVLASDALTVGSVIRENDVDVATVTSIGSVYAIARVSRSSAIGEPLG